jgi:nitroreductase
MNFRELLRRRRMVRAYRPEPVPREAIGRIVRSVRRAPSAGFSQGLRCVVVTDGERRRRLAEILGEASWVGDAPVLIVVCVREDDYHDRYREPDKLAVTGGVEVEWPIPFWYFDAGAAAMLILLAAIDEGYASGLFGVPVEALPAFRGELGLPGDVEITCCITVGRPADEDEASALSSRLSRRRRPLEEIVRWERWARGLVGLAIVALAAGCGTGSKEQTRFGR